MSDSQLKAHDKTTEDTAFLNTTEPSNKRGKFAAALVALALTGAVVLASSPRGTALRGAAFRNCGTRSDGGPRPWRDGKCWDGTFQHSCGSAYDCVSIDGKRWDDPSRIAVCRNKGAKMANRPPRAADPKIAYRQAGPRSGACAATVVARWARGWLAAAAITTASAIGVR